jgi:hypothetical protein
VGEGEDDVRRASAQGARDGGVRVRRGADRQKGGEAAQEAGGAAGGADEPGAGGGEMPGCQAQAQDSAGVAEESQEQGQDEGLDRFERARFALLGIGRDGDAQADGGLGEGLRN